MFILSLVFLGNNIVDVGVKKGVPDLEPGAVVAPVFEMMEVVVLRIASPWEDSEYHPWEFVTTVRVFCFPEA